MIQKFREIQESTILLATNIAEDLENSVDQVIFIDDHHEVLLRDVEQLDSLFDDEGDVA